MDLDVTTRSLLKLVLLPPGSIILVLLIGWLFARHFIGRLLILLATLCLYALSTSTGLYYLATLAETVPPPTAEQIRASNADAILVLLADARSNNPELGGAAALSNLSLARIDHALALHRMTGLPIALSGGSVIEATPPLAVLGADWLKDRAGIDALVLEASSRDTWENLRNSTELLHAKGVRRVLLVTHAYHMPRALLSAQAAGIDAIPAPFAYEHTPTHTEKDSDLESWLQTWLPHPGYLRNSYLMLHELAGVFWYRMRLR